MRKRFNLYIAIVAMCLFILPNCTSDQQIIKSENVSEDFGYVRAHNPWVFRSVIDKQARMITIALNDELWAAYNTQDCSLYKVWKGFVNFDGAVYNTVHGPQPTTIGDAYIVNEHKSPWVIIENAKTSPLNVQYKGHSFVKGQVVLKYELSNGNEKYLITERPEYSKGENGLHGFERTFEVNNLPEGKSIGFKTNISSVSGSTDLNAEQRNIKCNAPIKFENIKEVKSGEIMALNANAMLTLNADKATTLTTYFVKTPMIKNENKLEDEKELDKPLGYKLIARNDCKSCHNTYKKTIGPSYLAVARKYENSAENVNELVEKVKYGGSGVWGSTMMNAHPNVDDADIKAMVEYVMTLDAEEEKVKKENPVKKNVPLIASSEVPDADLLPGLKMKFVKISENIKGLDDISFNKAAVFEGIIPNLNIYDADLAWAGEWFAIEFEGYINVPKDNNYLFRLSSDDGSRMYMNGQMIVDNDGFHGMESRDGEMALKKGVHPFRVVFFQGSGGKSVRLQWKSFDDAAFKPVPASAILHHKKDQNIKPGAKAPPLASSIKIPGDGYPLAGVHPAFDLAQARPATFLPKVAGMDFMTNGDLIVSTWDAGGEVHLLSNVQSGDPAKIKVKTIARGLAEPLGLKVVDNIIYVLQKQELTQLIDNNGDGVIDEYNTLCNAWDVSANFHEFAFGLAEKDGWLYGNLAIGILPGGASAPDQPQHRGRTFRVEVKSGNIEFVSSGLRTPNGIGIGVDNEIFVADNEGDWLPSCKILHIKKDAWFGSRAVDFEGTASLKEKKPVVWLPQGEIGNSPGQITYLDKGAYDGQMIHGEVTHGGLKRVFAEKVNGEYQGAVFRFSQGLEAGINRLCWGNDGALYVGGVGSTGNWGHSGKLWYGLQKLTYNNNAVFEMLAVRAKTDGIEIEFTEALQEGEGWDKNLYTLKQWYYKPTAEYGGPKMGEQDLSIKSVNVSTDRKKVFLEIAGIKENHVVYVKLNEHLISAEGNGLYTTEAWYTMNAIPKDAVGIKTTADFMAAANVLSPSEKAAGWKLMFDGKSTAGWKNYGKESIGSSWTVEDGALTLAITDKADGGWQVKDGGDIVFENEFTNFEFSIDWKIQSCGNSGIMYLVEESENYDYPWMTGPEMQILDNTCHPDAKIFRHRAGDLYDIQECKYPTVKAAGEWNRAKVIVNNGKVEHWLNGVKVVETEFWTEDWVSALKSTKWKDFPDFGTKKKGKIALQDHGDRVWFRNIKVREL